MTKNKIIFFAVAAIGTLATGFLFMSLSGNSSSNQPSVSQGELSIWLYEDSANDFSESVINAFKEDYPEHANKNISVETFDDYYTYTQTLSRSIIEGTAPDIFSLNAGESAVYDSAVQVIDPSYISPNDFRLEFLPDISTQLIIADPNIPTSEYLVGVPLGFETLGIYFNRKYFTRPSELDSWSGLLSVVATVKDRSSIVPLALGNAAGVSRLSEVIQSLFVQEGVTQLSETSTSNIRDVLTFYKAFSDRSAENGYTLEISASLAEVDIDAFTSGEVVAMVGYPRDLEKIDAIGYQSSLLYAAPLPKFIGKENMQDISLRFLALNSASSSQSLAQEFMSYLASEAGQRALNSAFPYYISTNSVLNEELREQKIYPDYNIVYKNFLRDDATFVDFNVYDAILFKNGIYDVIDSQRGYEVLFDTMKSYIICSSTKSSEFLNLSQSCK